LTVTAKETLQLQWRVSNPSSWLPQVPKSLEGLCIPARLSTDCYTGDVWH